MIECVRISAHPQDLYKHFESANTTTTYLHTGRNAEAPGSLYPEFDSVRTRARVLKVQKEEDGEVMEEYGQPNADDAERCNVRG